MRFWRVRAWLAILLTLALVMAVGACGDDDEDGGADSAAAETQTVDLLLSFPEGPAWIGLPVARENGYLREEGITVKTEATDGSEFVVQQVIAGNAPYGMAAATSILIAAQRDPSLRAVFCNTSRNLFGIAVPEGSDIQEVADLKGKTLGISEQGGGETPLVTAALQDAGLTPRKDVDIVPIGAAGPASQAAIEDGEVDAYGSSYSDIIALQAAGVGLVDITPDKYQGVPGDCLFAKEEALSDPDERDAIIGLARAWSKGTLAAVSDPDRAIDVACERYPEECTDRDFIQAYMENRFKLVTPIGQEPGDTEIPYGTPQEESWQTALDLLVATDQVENPPEIESIIGTAEVTSIIEEWSNYEPADVA
jgi:NitT/TauT family transport system substrate-binding protein